MRIRARSFFIAIASVSLATAGIGATMLPTLGAGGVLHPFRRPVATEPPSGCDVVTFTGLDVTLEGWRCKPSGSRRGILIYLHGVADNRASGSGIIDRFRQRGFETIAYDSRAHGGSGGEACTYGVLEKEDLIRVLDQVEPGRVVLIGASLGAAVALQAAADDPRITTVVAAETFSDLRTVVRQRAPFFVTDGALARVFQVAERDGRFDVDESSPVAAAARITHPVMLIHGAADVDTPPDHSRRVFAALRGLRRLVLVPGATHNGSLRREVWPEIDQWIDTAVPPIG